MAISISVKLVIFCVFAEKLKIYLLKGKLPGELLIENKTVNGQAKNIFKKNIDLTKQNFYIEQLYTFSEIVNNNTKISIVYYTLISEHEIENRNKSNWLAIPKIKKDVADWKIISYAVQRLRWKIEYTNIIYSLLPREFTLSQLQTVYETILGKTLDKRNFRKKILSLKLLSPTGKKTIGIQARPAEIYEFRSRKPMIVKVFS